MPNSSIARRFPLRFAFGALAIVCVIAAVILHFTMVGGTSSASPAEQRAVQTGIDYGENRLVWNSGPTVRLTRVLALGNLESTLKATVSSRIRQDINVQQLLRQYGPRRRVAMVIFHGSYNTLPPDEGVIVNGDIVVLVDVRSNRVILGGAD